MKRPQFGLLLLSMLLSLLVSGGSVAALDITGFPKTALYPSYLADPMSVRTEVMYKQMLRDEIQPDMTGQGMRMDPIIGTQFSLFRLSPANRKDLGFEFDFGVSVPVYMNVNEFDLLGFDGVYYFAVALKPVDWGAVKFARHHICTHLGDELDGSGVGSLYADYDMGLFMNSSTFVRDEFVLSMMVDPIQLLLPASAVSLRLYSDIGLYVYGYDAILGYRNLISSDHAFGRYQYGAELQWDMAKGRFGSIYMAAHISRWQLSGYTPNLSARAGYIFPLSESARRVMLSAAYYDGQSTIHNFIYRREQYLSFVVTFSR
ncbi:MAG: hypothetical protein CVV52_17980 [Spirochaetae bacterium HGW-Spirochaetae-8]|nr:MAG: hypothetical protein CVV52_17980 [Spirochaetae bacterium HGW-Spirochaetae-8]